MAEANSIKGKAPTGPVTIEVYNPTGFTKEPVHFYAPRLEDLNNKVIGELSNGEWEDCRTFPLIRHLLRKRFPDAHIIPYTEFPLGVNNIDVENIGHIMKKRGCQAVIVGNSG